MTFLAACIFTLGIAVILSAARELHAAGRLLATADYTRERAAMVEHLARQRAEWRR